MTSTAVDSHVKTVKGDADHLRYRASASNRLRSGTSQEPSQFNAVIQLQPLALPPQAAAQLLSISKRSLSRLIAAGKIVARKEGSRTLVDVESLKAYYTGLPVKR
jgi:excisionase family DNA binding protein